MIRLAVLLAVASVTVRAEVQLLGPTEEVFSGAEAVPYVVNESCAVRLWSNPGLGGTLPRAIPTARWCRISDWHQLRVDVLDRPPDFNEEWWIYRDWNATSDAALGCGSGWGGTNTTTLPAVRARYPSDPRWPIEPWARQCSDPRTEAACCVTVP